MFIQCFLHNKAEKKEKERKLRQKLEKNVFLSLDPNAGGGFHSQKKTNFRNKKVNNSADPFCYMQ